MRKENEVEENEISFMDLLNTAFENHLEDEKVSSCLEQVANYLGTIKSLEAQVSEQGNEVIAARETLLVLEKNFEEKESKYQNLKTIKTELLEDIERVNVNISETKKTRKETQERLRKITELITTQEDIINEGSGWTTELRREYRIKEEEEKSLHQKLEKNKFDVQKLKDDLEASENRLDETNKENIELKYELTNLETMHETVNDNCFSLKQRKAEVLSSIEALKRELKNRNDEIEVQKKHLGKKKNERSTLERKKLEEKEKLETSFKAYDQLFHDVHQLVIAVKRHEKEIEKEQMYISQEEKELKRLENDKKQGMQDLSNLTQQKKKIEGEICAEQEKERSLNLKLLDLIQTNETMEKKMLSSSKENSIIEKNYKNVTNEIEIALGNSSKEFLAVDKLNKLLATYHNSTAALENEIHQLRKQAISDRSVIESKSKEIQLGMSQLNQTETQLLKCLDVKKEKLEIINNLRKALAEVDLRIQKQQGLYESMKNERNSSSKNLIEIQMEIDKKNKQLSRLNQMVKQLKDDAQVAENRLLQWHFDTQNMQEEYNSLRKTLLERKTKTQHISSLNKKQTSENKKLISVLSSSEEESKLLTIEHQGCLREMAILEKKRMDKRKELSEAYEIIKRKRIIERNDHFNLEKNSETIMAMNLHSRSLLNKLKLEPEIQGKRLELAKCVSDLEAEIQARNIKIKALEEQLECPVNFHYLRELEDKQPEVYAMLQEIRITQQQLNKTWQEHDKKSAELRNLTQQYGEVKDMVVERESDQLKEEIEFYKKETNQKKKDLKELILERSSKQERGKELNFEIKSLNEFTKNFCVEYVRKGVREFKAHMKEKLQQETDLNEKALETQLKMLVNEKNDFSSDFSSSLSS
eukprot:snap_masked-scaffold_51-processed-gene-1.26-mRNA-1 protein AED:1.00 eAED:1.00 QI:0/-1/0/0/-1/1/1/0/872